MPPEETPINEAPETSTANIPASEGGETTTPEEVAKVMGLPPQEAPEEEPEEPEEPEAPEEPETPEEEPEEPSEPKAPEQPEAPEENSEVPSFVLEVEDANGEKFTLNPGDNLEEVLKDFEPKSNGQIFQIIKEAMQLEQDKAKYDAEQAEKTAEAERAAEEASIREGWGKEIEALQGDKRIPVTNDGEKNERVGQVFQYMNEENQKRIEDGRPLIRSFEDALDKLELRESKEAEKQKAKEEKEAARKKGALVGGSSAPASNAPVYTGGARNANEAIRALGLL